MTENRPYTPHEVAKLLRVDPRTVSRWCLSGRLDNIVPGVAPFRTPGGHFAIPAALVDKLPHPASPA